MGIVWREYDISQGHQLLPLAKLKPMPHHPSLNFSMNQTQDNSRDLLLQTLDSRIRSLEESFVKSVRVLRLERNALVPISSLPPEIFAAIFSFLCFNGGVRGYSGHNLARIHLSHVCHQWREIALNQPFLWSHVDFTTLTWAGAAEILARTKSAPLYLEARISYRYWNGVRFDTFRNELQARIPHICYLGIRADCAHLHSTLSALKQPAPTLEYLSSLQLNVTIKRRYLSLILFPTAQPLGSPP